MNCRRVGRGGDSRKERWGQGRGETASARDARQADPPPRPISMACTQVGTKTRSPGAHSIRIRDLPQPADLRCRAGSRGHAAATPHSPPRCCPSSLLGPAVPASSLAPPASGFLPQTAGAPHPLACRPLRPSLPLASPNSPSPSPLRFVLAQSSRGGASGYRGSGYQPEAKRP